MDLHKTTPPSSPIKPASSVPDQPDPDDGNLIIDDSIAPSSRQHTLPADFFPPCWHDDDRMSILFAPFRSRALNPLNYDTKLHFWQQLIAKYCQHKGSASCTLAELRDAFRRHHKTPAYPLATVLQEMRAADEVRPTAQFMEPPQNTLFGWAQKCVWSALAWPVHKMTASLRPATTATTAAGGASSPGGVDAVAAQTELVVLEVVQQHARLLQRNADLVEKVVDLAQVVRAGKPELSADGVRLAVHHLYCTRRAVMRSVPLAGDGSGVAVQLVKISGEDGERQPTIDEAECNVYCVRRAVEMQQLLLNRLDAQHSEADRLARELVAEKKKTLAMVQLRKRKQLDEKIRKESDKLLNLETMLSSIEDSKHSATVVDAYKLAANALRQTNVGVGITVDKVCDVMDDVQEALDDHHEIQQTLGETKLEGGAGAKIDESTLEAELDELLAQDQIEKEQKERELNESIERRLAQLNMSGFGDLSMAEQRQILVNSAKAEAEAVP